jgi:ribosomal protein L39E
MRPAPPPGIIRPPDLTTRRVPLWVLLETSRRGVGRPLGLDDMKKIRPAPPAGVIRPEAVRTRQIPLWVAMNAIRAGEKVGKGLRKPIFPGQGRRK